MSTMEAPKIGEVVPPILDETAQAEEMWAQEVIRELRDGEAVETQFQNCIARKAVCV